MKIKGYEAVLNLLHSIIGSFGLEGTSGNRLIQLTTQRNCISYDTKAKMKQCM